MKALTFHGKEKIVYETVKDPELAEETDVVVKVTRTAICGSDLHIYHERETGLDIGTVMGHEFVGKIAERGRVVKNWRIGDLVFSPFTTNCGHCFFCRNKLPCRCTNGQLFGWVENGIGLPGTQAEYIRVPLADTTLMKIPEDILSEEALLLGDILSTGYFCADMANIEKEGTYVVIGCGPVGLLAILSVRELGAETIYAIESVDYRLNLAQQFGAIPVNFKLENPVELILQVTNGRGADAVLELVGSAQAGRMAFEIVRPGGTISVVGVHTEKNLPFSPVEAYNKNITYKTGRCPVRYYMEKLLPLVQSRKYDFTAVISHRINLADGVTGYEIFDQKRENCTKIVLEP